MTVGFEDWPQNVGHGEGDMLPFAVGQDGLLFRYPLVGAFYATRIAGTTFTGVAQCFRVQATAVAAGVSTTPHGQRATRQHLSDVFHDDIPDVVIALGDVVPGFVY